MQTLISFFGVNSFIPHGVCLSWNPVLLWLNIISDALIALSYYSLPISILYFIKKRGKIPYAWFLTICALFIIACGTTHLMHIILIWIPLYWLDGYLKALTAIISVTTAVAALWVVPFALRLPAIEQLLSTIHERDIANAELAFQNAEKAKRAAELVIANTELAFQNAEKAKRADELVIANTELAFQNAEKAKRADELEIANVELAFQNAEKAKRADELDDFYTKNKLLQNQVNHMQKLESIGRLTSGIAHDFNNILMCIMGYNEINKMDSEDVENESLRKNIENNAKQIDLAGKRAAVLIDKMLTYCRQENDGIKKINVQPTQTVINEALELLRPALTNRIKFETVFECDEIIFIDMTDFHQILTNLAVNARDAMKECGGVITVSLKNVTNMKAYCVACASVIEGDLIQLSMADNGTGIEPKIMSRLFDPFFTTKPQGEGTGLGLSSVSGLVHQAGGHILVKSNQSKLNHSTEFKLLFPINPLE